MVFLFRFVFVIFPIPEMMAAVVVFTCEQEERNPIEEMVLDIFSILTK